MQPGVAISPDDIHDEGLPVAGPGLRLAVPASGRWLQRPSLHLEAAPRYRLRLMSGGQPLLWFRIDSYWDQSAFLRGTPHAPWGLPPLSAPDVRSVTHAPGTPAWWEAWAWRTGRALVEAPATVLYAGQWCLRPLRAIPADRASRHAISPMEWGFGQPFSPPHSLEEVLHFAPFWKERWWDEEPKQRPGAVLPLRAPSAAEEGRIKSWRKHARGGTLPPVLLLYVDLLSKWLVLDGHDRVHAALLEGVEPPLLGLWPFIEPRHPRSEVRETGALMSAEFQLRAGATPEVIDRVNRMLVRNFEPPERGTVSRAWPIRGGLEAWRAEVLAWRRWNGLAVDEDAWEWFVSGSE
ncbi:hypothetical protein HPC49_29905 [Pyxidicoccus fallax]|uniref:Uncharacterized protein n=1 Tax=Pyxidicoccus fallax TaxID=394095 RepID=A0A848L6G2_9BACT|nr:hypothetical protein [Pyxidicoccus fallax]NMO14319.1 hypothetical protein [Pyxidicoccus fallax]NPC82423.1 hypothetical protein [Pyxidicoccus fallax]